MSLVVRLCKHEVIKELSHHIANEKCHIVTSEVYFLSLPAYFPNFEVKNENVAISVDRRNVHRSNDTVR